MKSGKKLTKEQKQKIKEDYLIALAQNGGIIRPSIEAVGIKQRSTIINWRKEDSVFDEACAEIEEGAIDVGEENLFKKVKEGDVQAIKFYLSCKGKKRGYVEKSQLDINATLVRPRMVYDDEVQSNTEEHGKDID